jgi:hypothetical protein
VIAAFWTISNLRNWQAQRLNIFWLAKVVKFSLPAKYFGLKAVVE